MHKNRWFSSLVTPRKDSLGVFILLINALTWHYMTVLVIDTYLRISGLSTLATLTVWVTYFGSIIASSAIGSIVPFVARTRFLYSWMLLGAALSFLPVFSFIPPQLWCLALGLALGLGMPACLAYFADCSKIENRGKTGGIIFLSSSLGAAILAVAFTQLDLTMSILILVLWRSAGLGMLAFIPLKTNPGNSPDKKQHVSFRKIIGDRSLHLYLAAWVMFILIDRSTWALLGRNLDPSLNTVAVIGPLLGSVAALVGGVLSDRMGRKKIVISGFVALGLAYGMLGIAPDFLFSWYLYLAVDGIAWGILFVTFLLTLWGDLSQQGGSEKYYMIGAVPYYSARIMESIIATTVLEIAPYTTFSLASIFLFIAVLPLLFAPETLPEKKIEIRRLRGYLDQAKKLREKH